MELTLVFLLVAFSAIAIWLGLSTRTRFEGTKSLGDIVSSWAQKLGVWFKRRSTACPNCGNRLDPSQVHCPYCALPAAASPPPVEPTARVAPPPVPMSHPGTCLMIVRGDSPGQIIKLEGVTTMGRDVSFCDVVLEDAGVSPYHARVELQDNQFVICDLASATGTYVNECDVGRTVLMDGDVIRIGCTTFVFKEVMPEQGTEEGPEPKHEHSALVKAKLPSKMYAGDACVVNLQIVLTDDMAVSGSLDEGRVVSSLKFMTSEETSRVEAELLAVGLSVAGELKQMRPFRLHQPAICYWSISPPESGRFEMGFVFRVEAKPGQWEEVGMFTHQLTATKYDGLRKEQIQLLAGLFGGAAAVLGILETLHQLGVLALFRK